MKIWWCQEHQASYQDEPNPDPPTWGCWYTADMADAAADCRMVPMRLIPDDDDVIGLFSYGKRELEIPDALDGETP